MTLWRKVESVVLLLPVRLALAALFLFSAFQKLKPGTVPGPQQFATNIKAFEILPDELIGLATYTIPWAEAIGAILLILGLWARPAALLLSSLITVFTIAVISILARKMSVDCGCFGKGGSLICPPDAPIGWCKVLENCLILLAAVLIVIRGGGLVSLDHRLESSKSPSPDPLRLDPLD